MITKWSRKDHGMNTLTDVLLRLIELSPLREESEVTHLKSIVEASRKHLDNFAEEIEEHIQSVEDDAQKASDAAKTPVNGL
jgi:hypothetical protein